MGYLDSKGLSLFWGKVKAALSAKQDSLTPGDGIALENGTISVTTPVKSMTQAEYDALSEAEKQADVLYILPGASPNSGQSPVPTGAVIGFLALSAPSGYLVCDGAEHPIKKYQELADYIAEQFGTLNHFGGDGAATFAVPDMRNLFLRGYHGEAEERLSDDVGARQEGTEQLMIDSYQSGSKFLLNSGSGSPDISTWDKAIHSSGYGDTGSGEFFPTVKKAGIGVARPVNMAVLYCIKT